jgi:hypothetical protein
MPKVPNWNCACSFRCTGMTTAGVSKPLISRPAIPASGQQIHRFASGIRTSTSATESRRLLHGLLRHLLGGDEGLRRDLTRPDGLLGLGGHGLGDVLGGLLRGHAGLRRDGDGCRVLRGLRWALNLLRLATAAASARARLLGRGSLSRGLLGCGRGSLLLLLLLLWLLLGSGSRLRGRRGLLRGLGLRRPLRPLRCRRSRLFGNWLRLWLGGRGLLCRWGRRSRRRRGWRGLEGRCIANALGGQRCLARRWRLGGASRGLGPEHRTTRHPCRPPASSSGAITHPPAWSRPRPRPRPRDSLDSGRPRPPRALRWRWGRSSLASLRFICETLRRFAVALDAPCLLTTSASTGPLLSGGSHGGSRLRSGE